MATIANKGPLNTYLLKRIVCVLLPKFEKRAAFFWKHVTVPRPHPIQCWKSVEISGSSFQHRMWDGRWCSVGKVVIMSGVCLKVPKLQICPKTFVHDCSWWAIKQGGTVTNLLAPAYNAPCYITMEPFFSVLHKIWIHTTWKVMDNFRWEGKDMSKQNGSK